MTSVTDVTSNKHNSSYLLQKNKDFLYDDFNQITIYLISQDIIAYLRGITSSNLILIENIVLRTVLAYFTSPYGNIDLCKHTSTQKRYESKHGIIYLLQYKWKHRFFVHVIIKHREMNHLSIFSLNNVAGNIHENIHSYMVYGLHICVFVFVC